MTVIECNRMRDGRTGSADVDGNHEYVARWHVTTNTRYDGPSVVRAQAPYFGSTPTPQRYTAYQFGNDYDPYSLALSQTIAQMANSAYDWIVTVQYGPPEGFEEEDDNPNPLLRPVKYWVETETFSKVFEKDLDGKAILNGIGRALDPAYEDDDSRDILCARFNIETLGEVRALKSQYNRSFNSDDFYGHPPKHVKMQRIVSGEQQTENDISFYPTTLRMAARDTEEGSWEVELLNQGMAYFKSPGDEEPTNKLPNGEIITEPVNLNEDGTLVAKGGEPHFIKPKTLTAQPYNAIGV